MGKKPKFYSVQWVFKWIHAPPMKKCSLLDLNPFNKYNNPKNSDIWHCTNCIENTLPFNNLNDTQFLLLQNEQMDQVSDDLNLYPDESLNHFTESCETVSINFADNDVNDDILKHVNSKYYNMHNFNKIKSDLPSSIGFLHINIASIYQYHGDLLITLSYLKFVFHVIALTEHKIRHSIPIQNIEIPGYHEFSYDCSATAHGDTGLYVLKYLAYQFEMI